MTLERHLHSADILPFRHRRVEHQSRFTMADKIEVLRWHANSRAALRLIIYSRHESDPPEIGEFANIYTTDDRWAAWGAVRQDGAIRVWQSHDGREIGNFPTMMDALRTLATTTRKPFRRKSAG